MSGDDRSLPELDPATNPAAGDLLYLWTSYGDLKLDLAILRTFARAQASIVSRSAAGALTAADYGKFIHADATGSAFAISLPPTPPDGAIVIIRKIDATAHRVTIRTSAGTDLAWLSSVDDFAIFHANAGAWLAGERRIAPISYSFAVSGTLPKAPLSTRLRVQLKGGAGGGGGGRRGAASTMRLGGYGGAGGAIVDRILPASLLGSTETITIGAGGLGASANAVNDSDGAFGADGGTTRLGSLLAAIGGSGGHGGAASLVAPVPGPRTGAGFISGDGGMPGSDSAAITPLPAANGGGGAGGSIDATNVLLSGSQGGGSVEVAGGSPGYAGARDGGDGTAAGNLEIQDGGSGGGGGYPSLIAPGGDGGHGGSPGGGGAGGAASVNGQASGAGGDGGPGHATFTWFFD